MKTARLVMAVMIGVVMLGSAALAEEGDPVERKRQRMRVRQEARKDHIERVLKELNLSAEQQTQVKQILETHRQAVENWLKENGEDLKTLREQMRKARKEKDHKALKGLRKKMADGMKGRRELQKSLRKQIEAVLTDEQKTKAKEMMRRGHRAVIGARMVRRALGQVGLTDKQEEQIKKIVAETQSSACKVESPKEKVELWQKAVKTIKSDVLTKEQAKKFEQSMNRMRRRYGRMMLMTGLNLTDEQKAQAKKIREKYHDKIENAEPEERWELMKKMREELESILTDEQKAKAKKHRRRMFQGRGDWAGLNLTDEQKAQAEKIREDYRNKMDSILTDEQKAKVKERHEGRRKRWQNRRGRNGGRRGSGNEDIDE